MSQYHRHFAREWDAFRRETNYALTGNVRYHSTTPTMDEWRQERRRIRHAIEATRVSRKCIGWSERAEALAWLRWAEGAA